MNLPLKGDYIDIHTHEAVQVPGIFSIDVLMAHEERMPGNTPGILYTMGIHPWFLTELNHKELIAYVAEKSTDPMIIAIGEAGFDKIKGPSMDLQRKVFEEQAAISEEAGKPLVVHCVRAWDELLGEHRRLRPKQPWMVHGFRGKTDLAKQLITKGMYISFWFDYIIKPESSGLVRSLPGDRIFLETDGADIDIRDIYYKVSLDLGMPINELKIRIWNNFKDFFGIR